jgi:hypothetical protein
MSSNPVSFRFPFEVQIASLPPEVQMVHRTTWNAILDLQGAVPLLKSQIDANKTAVASATSSTNTTSSSESTVIVTTTIGMVNDQTGQTTYATQQTDYGAFILFGDTSPIAVTLTQGTEITIPWYAILINNDSGLVTATPATGFITYPGNPAAASMPVPQNTAAFIAYDGADFYAILVPISPQNTPQIASQWLNSYDSETGVFGQSEPAISDISGLTAALALLAPLASPAFTGIPTAPTAAPLTDNTQIATTGYCDSAVAVEKSRAQAAEALLAPIASPTFTGVVTMPNTPVVTAATTASSATSGAGSALPTTPALYVEISINSVTYKIPLFNV